MLIHRGIIPFVHLPNFLHRRKPLITQARKSHTAEAQHIDTEERINEVPSKNRASISKDDDKTLKRSISSLNSTKDPSLPSHATQPIIQSNSQDTNTTPPKPGRPSRGRPRQQPQHQSEPTELIFKLERRGDGWGEEFIPHLTIEQRPIQSPQKSKKQQPISKETLDVPEGEDDASASDGLHSYLRELGVNTSDIEKLVGTAVAWRVTPGGRPLIDRRRQSRLARNIRIVAEYLERECGVPLGPDGVGAVFVQVPELMLCKPTSNDRWDRRAVELAAFRLKYGNCNVPENWEPNIELGAWVKRQRIARAASQLSEERLTILERMGFEFGDLAQITEEWEQRFDQLVDWMLWHGENGQAFSWVGIDWGQRGGITARELALWIALQKEFHRRQLLPIEAMTRFQALHFEWEAPSIHAADATWMSWLGKLMYVVERRCLSLRRPLQPRPNIRMVRKRAMEAEMVAKDIESIGDGSMDDEDDSAVSLSSSSNGNGNGVRGGRNTSSSAGQAARSRIASVISARRESFARKPLTEEPGLAYWVARQRWLWRQGRLPAEQVRMLHLAGVDMDTFTPALWQIIAHTAAEVVQGSKISLEVQREMKVSIEEKERMIAAALEQEKERARATAMPVTPVRGRPRRKASANGATDGVSTGSPSDADTIQSTGAESNSISAAAVVTTAPASSSAAMVDGPSSTSTSRGASTQLPSIDALTKSDVVGNKKLRVKRWVQCQQAMFADGRLSPVQLRYLAFLGITWMLSDKVIHMPDDAWQKQFLLLAAGMKNREKIDPAVEEWLQHQQGLYALGMLSPLRQRALKSLGVRWTFDRSDADDEWDYRLSQLLVQSVEAGNLQVTRENERFDGLAEWLQSQRDLATSGNMPANKVSQFMALGVSIDI